MTLISDVNIKLKWIDGRTDVKDVLLNEKTPDMLKRQADDNKIS